jgi:Tfp pilus assembly protein PilN
MVVYIENAKTSNVGAMKIPGMEALPAPAVEKVPVDFHEAYALAMHQETNLDFAETGRALEARELTRSRARALQVIRAAFVVVALMVATLLVLKGGSIIGASYVNRKTAPIMTHLKRYKTEKSRLESLSLQMKEKTQFFGRKSALTYPISEMQTAFPEGLWAEEIAFSESSQEQWNFSIIAFSNSSALIPELLKNLSIIKGMDNVRMTYSEQTAVKSKTGERAIKFRIEGVYNKKERF